MSPERRIGVYLCRRDDDARGPLDRKALADHAIQLPGVRAVRVVPAPEALDPETLAQQLRQERLDTIVLVADSPGFFKGAFARALAEAGGDPGGSASPRSASTARRTAATTAGRWSAPRPSWPAPSGACRSASRRSRGPRR